MSAVWECMDSMGGLDTVHRLSDGYVRDQVRMGEAC